MIDGYDWRGGREAMLRFGPAAGPVVIAALPPLEEANRTRALLVAALRLLARDGMSSALPDLPGQGESLLPTRDATLADWRAAFGAAAAVARATHIVSVRAGAMIEELLPLPRWRLSPQDGPSLLRELGRMGEVDRVNGCTIAGNSIGPALLAELDEAPVTAPARCVRLASDPAPADARLEFAPPWRRIEPDADGALAAAIAADIAAWVRACGG